MYYPGFIIFAISILVALSIHEAAHAWAAYILGDNTAKNQGRLTLDPRKHLDLYGTLMFLFAGIGWGKPVPVDSVYFKNPKRDSALVALAGPFSNFLLALVIGTLAPSTSGSLQQTLLFMVDINIALCAFNLIPIPPLDGSKILGLFIPHYQFYRYTQFIHNHLAYILMIFLIDIKFLGASGNSIFLNFISFISTILKSLIFFI